MSEFRASSTIVNAASGLQIIQNAANDLSLKVISGDATKNVTIIRLRGESAKADIDTLYQLFSRLFDVVGLEP
jgi:hypothetical protein